MKLTTWIATIILLMAGTIYSQGQAFVNNSNNIASAAFVAANEVTLININKADVKTLASLPGLGEKKAEAIIAYRERNGNFKSVDELVNVKGIGEKMMTRLQALITV